MSQQNTFSMNRKSNSKSDGPAHTTNTRPNYKRSPNTSRDNRNPYHKNRSQPRYQPQPLPPKEKVLGPEDFPALPSLATSKHVAAKSAWTKPEVSLADKMREIQEKEEEARRLGITSKEEDAIDVVPLTAWRLSQHRAKKREEEERRQEIEEEEEQYRWQISGQMIPPKPEPEVPVYDENADIYDEELECTPYDYDQEAPVYEERI